MRGEIIVEKDPATSGLGAWDEAAFGARPELFGVHSKKMRSFLKVERLHDLRVPGSKR